jgi:5-bromo-4-chloroindolyl phosphate hydrolysis protein
VLTFTNAAEQAAWAMAEALSDKAFSAMKQAEEAAEAFRSGKMAMRRQFKARGLSDVDADIRWSQMTQAKKALSDNDWYMSQASMYNEAAGAQYAKALYLKSR